MGIQGGLETSPSSSSFPLFLELENSAILEEIVGLFVKKSV